MEMGKLGIFRGRVNGCASDRRGKTPCAAGHVSADYYSADEE